MASDDTLTGDTRSAARAELPLAQGDTIGRYLILMPVGSGGMGSVYAAYDPELDRKVAIKLLHGEMGTSGSGSGGRHGKLVREAQAMARLRHPNVTAVHDVGEHEGRVFLAMEFVDGSTLGAWLKREKRDWREVLHVMVRAGRGLAAAHEAGLVHRDFKPDNVMVGDDGRVEVMDFGLAARAGKSKRKLGDDQPKIALLRDQHLLATGGIHELPTDGSIVGTPAYMAPEQHTGLPTDERSDQFSFCIALYEALYRQRPFTGDSLASLAYNVTHGEVRDPPAEAKIPGWLRRAMLRGLAPEPPRRWPSMDALLAELARDPSKARRKWAMAGLVVLALGGLGAGVWGVQEQRQRVCQGAERKLTGVWDESRREIARQAMLDTQLAYGAATWERTEQLLDAYASTWVAAHVEACEATRVREEQSIALMDLRMRCLTGRLRNLDALVQAFAGADERVVEKAVQAASGLPRIARCAEPSYVQAQVEPPDDPEVAKQVDELRGEIARATALKSAGKYEEGLTLARHAAENARTLGYIPIRAEADFRLGDLTVQTGAYEEAETSLRSAYFDARRSGARETMIEAASTLTYVVGHKLARHDDGLEWARHAEADIEHDGAPDDQATLNDHVGAIRLRQGLYDEALSHFERARSYFENARHERHPHVAIALNNAGLALYKKGEYDGALDRHRRALEIWEDELGPQHPSVGHALTSIGTALAAKGDYEQALEHHRRALDIWEEAHGADNVQVAAARTSIGSVLRRQGKNEEALDYLVRALEIKERALGTDHLDVASAANALGNVYRAQGRADQALEYYRRTLEIFEDGLGSDHPHIAVSLDNIGLILEQRGDYAKALERQRRALAIREHSFGLNHSDVARSLNNIGLTLEHSGDDRAAILVHRRALAIRERIHGRDHPDIATSLTNLASALGNLGRHTQALALNQRGLEIREATLRSDHPHLAYSLLGVARAYLGLGAAAAAVAPAERAMEIRERGDAGVAQKAEACFVLARALWSTNNDRSRAVELAGRAKKGFAANEEANARRLAAVKDWLRHHRA